MFSLLGGTILNFHQDVFAQSSVNAWRPNDGVYAGHSTNESAEERCKEFGDVILDLSRKKVGGGEQECEITKLKQTSAIEFTLSLICTDAIDPESSNEYIKIKRVDDGKIFFRETMGGKFSRPGAEMIYCSDEIQQAYIKQRAEH